MTFSDNYLNTKNATPLRIGGQKLTDSDIAEVLSPYSGDVVGRVHIADGEDLDKAVEVSRNALTDTKIPAHQRAVILETAAKLLAERKEDFARIIASEAAKPIKTARVEVDRAVQTFLFSASVARNSTGEMIALDAHPSGENKIAFTFREPIGVVAAIAPFNFPLNLVAHKVAPAIAAGCPVVLKPAMSTPFSSAALVDLLIDECGLPGDWLSFVPCPGAVAAAFTKNENVAMISFTGSPGVGWSIRADAPKKKVALELGNNAPVIIHSDADVESVSASVTASGYSFQGQSCISVQRVYVHSSIYEEFLTKLKTKVEALVVGDPLNDETDVSSLIAGADSQRVSDWIQTAVNQGARLVAGGDKSADGVLRPTVLADTSDDMDVCRKEVFGPVVSVMSYENFEDALKRANDSSYGLQAAVFTKDISRALHAARTLNFGGVLINETPTYRSDNMPYGGIRDSGNTKEGPAHAVHEMTVEKLVILNEI